MAGQTSARPRTSAKRVHEAKRTRALCTLAVHVLGAHDFHCFGRPRDVKMQSQRASGHAGSTVVGGRALAQLARAHAARTSIER